MIPAAEPANTALPRTSARRLAWFLVIAGAVPFAIVLLAIPLTLSSIFQKYCDSFWLTAGADLLTTANRPCDIVLFGDSSVMVGMDPRIISARTHLTTCNIGSTLTIMDLVGLRPLDAYLKRNPRPRYLLFEFSARNLHAFPVRHPDVAADAYLPLLRYGYANDAIREMFNKPDSFIGVAEYAYIKGYHNARMYLLHGQGHNHVAGVGSYITLPDAPLTACTNRTELPLSSAAADWVRQTRDHFRPYADEVIFNVAPTSTCNPLATQWSNALSGTTDDSLRIYPNHLFVDADYHTSREGAVLRSEEIADQILALENQSHTAQAAPIHSTGK